MAKQDVELKFSLIDGVSRSLAAIQQGVSGLGASLVKINAAAELTGKAFGAIGDVAGAFGDAVVGAASVEDALTRVNSITNATVEEQKALQDAVRGAVEGTRFSAEEAAGALVLLAEDGFSAKEAVDQLGSVLQFAQANAQSAAAATGALGAVLDTFGEKPAVIGALADTLTAVARGAGTSTKALQEGLAGVGNAADQAGISLNDTIGYLGLLASRGIEGGAAVGNFNKIIREIEDPASKAGQALAALGMQGADFATVLNRLGKDSVAAETVLSALGRKPREALRVLLTEGGGDLGKFAGIIKQATGATKDASDALNNTFAGALARISNQLEQTRNDLLTPILAPLATEFQAFSAQLSDFAKTEQFALIVEQFRLFATSAIQYVGEAVRSFDFAKAVEAVQAFASNAVELFRSVEQSLSTVANAVNDTAKVIRDSYQSLADFSGKVQTLYTDFVDGTTNALNVAGDGVKALGEETDRAGVKIERAGKGLKNTADFAAKLAKETDQAGKSAVKAGAGLDVMAQAAADAAFNSDSVITPAKELYGVLGGIPAPAGKTAVALDSVSGSSSVAAQSLNQLEGRLKTVREALANAPQGSPAFIKLAQDAATLEEQIKLAKEAIDAASGSNENLADSANKAAEALRRLRQEQEGNTEAGGNLQQQNEDTADSFGNIANQSSSVAISIGTLTEEFVRNALAAAGNAKSVRDYLRTLNDFFAQGADEEKQLRDAIEIRERQNAQLTEEDRIRRRIKDQYGESSTLVEKLVQIELKLAEARKKTNDESQRGFEIEQRRAGLAGGIGTQGGPQTAAPATSAGRGSFAGAPRDNSAINITINQNGATPETIRDLAPLIERELGRLGALRR